MNAGLLCNLKKNYNTHNQFILCTIYVPFFVWKRTQLPITRQLLEEECRNTWNILYKVEYHIITCWIHLHSQKPINHHKKKENVLDQKNYLHISIWCMHILLSAQVIFKKTKANVTKGQFCLNMTYQWFLPALTLPVLAII